MNQQQIKRTAKTILQANDSFSMPLLLILKTIVGRTKTKTITAFNIFFPPKEID